MLQNGFDRSLSKKQCSLMLFELVSCQKQGMRINRILPKFFVRRVCNKAIAESLEAKILWESLVSMLEEKYSYSQLLGPTTAVALLNGVDHRALLWSKAINFPQQLGPWLGYNAVATSHAATLCFHPPSLPGYHPVPLGITTFAASDFCSASKLTAVQSPWPYTTSDQGWCY